MKHNLRITASRVPALLGLNKWQSVSEAMQETVASAVGLRWEIDNEIFAYGREHEPVAIEDLKQAFGSLATFHNIGEDQLWMQATIDGIVVGAYADGIVEFIAGERAGKRYLLEVKCPYTKKARRLAETHYESQIYTQLAVASAMDTVAALKAERTLNISGYIYFCWVDSGDEKPEVVDVSPSELKDWWDKTKPQLKERWFELEGALADDETIEKFTQSYHKVINATDEVDDYLSLDNQIKELQKKKQEVAKQLWGAERNVAFARGDDVVLSTIYSPTRTIDRKTLEEDLRQAVEYIGGLGALPDLVRRLEVGLAGYEKVSWSRRVKIPGPRSQITRAEAEEHLIERAKI